MSTVLEVRQALTDNGYTIVPGTGKTPPFRPWQKTENGSRPMLEHWDRNWPGADNTGILPKHPPTLDVDILNEPAAIAVEDLVRKWFDGRGRFLSRIGRPPKRAF